MAGRRSCSPAAPRPAKSRQFVARQLLTMPDPLRSGLAAAPGRPLFAEITGQTRRPVAKKPATPPRRGGCRC